MKVIEKKTTRQGITDTSSWTHEHLRQAYEELKSGALQVNDITTCTKSWWETLENENTGRLPMLFRLAEELRNRNANIDDFFTAFVYSNTADIQANLHYLDYLIASGKLTLGSRQTSRGGLACGPA